MALIAMIQGVKLSGRFTKMALVALGIFGASLFYGDGMITPAISVLAAPISGPKGTLRVRTGWIYRTGEDVSRLATLYPLS